MRRVLQTISWLSLGAVIVPSLLFLMGQINLELVKRIMLAATCVWFVITPFWMERNRGEGGAA